MTNADDKADIVARLRDAGSCVFFEAKALDLQHEAASEIDRLREALVWAALKIRSFPGTDQSDVELIRAALSHKNHPPQKDACIRMGMC